MKIPVVLVTGVDPSAMARTVVGVQFDVPSAVVVCHTIDVECQVLTCTVSDITGVIERHEVALAHACVACAIREDIVPTLRRLARDGRWGGIIAQLPTGAEAAQLSLVLEGDRDAARVLRIATVVATLGAADVAGDLLGGDLLADRNLHSSVDDRRGVGEVLAGMIEYADVIVFDDHPSREELDLVQALSRPDAVVAEGAHRLEGLRLVNNRHPGSAARRWAGPMRTAPLPARSSGHAWQLDLRSSLPMHPARLLNSIEDLGGGPHRSRGCFWLPTRPDRILEWNGAGGQLSIGDRGWWSARAPFTRLVLTGLGALPAQLRRSFDAMLLTPEEQSSGWRVTEDGFEPWLGPIREVA